MCGLVVVFNYFEATPFDRDVLYRFREAMFNSGLRSIASFEMKRSHRGNV
jgi:hypothetical protein